MNKPSNCKKKKGREKVQHKTSALQLSSSFRPRLQVIKHVWRRPTLRTERERKRDAMFKDSFSLNKGGISKFSIQEWQLWLTLTHNTPDLKGRSETGEQLIHCGDLWICRKHDDLWPQTNMKNEEHECTHANSQKPWTSVQQCFQIQRHWFPFGFYWRVFSPLLYLWRSLFFLSFYERDILVAQPAHKDTSAPPHQVLIGLPLHFLLSWLLIAALWKVSSVDELPP